MWVALYVKEINLEALKDRKEEKMAYIKHKNRYEIGERTKTTILHDSCAGFFEIGTEVTVTGIGPRGYDIEDDDGNRIIEIGWVI